MSTSEAELPPCPDPQTGEPRPPAPPGILGLTQKSAKTTASAGAPPPEKGPALAVQGKDWWFAPAGAAFLSVITGIIFSLQGSDWTDDPIQWALIGMVFVVTLVREWGLKLVAGADWLRVNRKWVDTYALTRIELRGVWFGWMLRLKDTEGRHLRTYMTDLEANRDLWALVYNGMLHSAFHGATVNNTAAGMLRLRPGFEAMRYQERHRGPKIPNRTVWTFLLVIVGVFAAIYFLRPDLLGPALAIFAGLVLLLLLIAGITITIARRHQRRQDAPRD